MSETATSDLKELQSKILNEVIDALSGYMLDGSKQLTPGEVMSVMQDICLDVHCSLDAFPRALTTVYEDARKRTHLPTYGCVNFSLEPLIHNMERALIKVV